MPNWGDAVRHLFEAGLRCPHCGAENVPDASPTVVLDDDGQRAECTNCSAYGVVTLFRKEESDAERK